MKKLLSLIAALAVMLLCAAPAMAAGFTARISLRLNNDQPLQPNQEYRIPILAQYEDEPPTQLRAEDLGGGGLLFPSGRGPRPFISPQWKPTRASAGWW